MPKTTFDSNIFIARSRTNMKLPSNFYMSVVVMQELAIGAEDATEIKDPPYGCGIFYPSTSETVAATSETVAATSETVNGSGGLRAAERG